MATALLLNGQNRMRLWSTVSPTIDEGAVNIRPVSTYRTKSCCYHSFCACQTSDVFGIVFVKVYRGEEHPFHVFAYIHLPWRLCEEIQIKIGYRVSRAPREGKVVSENDILRFCRTSANKSVATLSGSGHTCLQHVSGAVFTLATTLRKYPWHGKNLLVSSHPSPVRQYSRFSCTENKFCSTNIEELSLSAIASQ